MTPSVAGGSSFANDAVEEEFGFPAEGLSQVVIEVREQIHNRLASPQGANAQPLTGEVGDQRFGLRILQHALDLLLQDRGILESPLCSHIDQFVVRNPSYFFDASPERALIDPDNLHILVDHIKCAAFELPFTTDETFGRHDVQEILGVLAEQGLVHYDGAARNWTWTNESYPADAVSLRPGRGVPRAHAPGGVTSSPSAPAMDG